MVTTMDAPVRIGTTVPSRLEIARQALELVAERDPRVVEQQSAQLFTEQMRVLGPARALCPQYAQALSPDDFFAFDERAIEITGMAEAGDRVVAYIEFAGTHRDLAGREPCERSARAQGLVILQFRGDRIDEAWSVLRWA
jgi:predicted ester cyclase